MQPSRCLSLLSRLAAAALASVAAMPAQSSVTEVTLHSFGPPPKGASPQAALIRDAAGNFYGTASAGGLGYGTVFKIDPEGTTTVLYTFRGGTDGATPMAGVIRDVAGNLYGTTYFGGAGSIGTVYKIDPSGQETLIYSFGGEGDGGNPAAGLVQDDAGNLYGTTLRGGASFDGTVFKIDSSGRETVLHSFTGGTDGSHPFAGLIQDSSGNLYGTASGGGSSNEGVVYRIDSSGNETVLYSFKGGKDGSFPQSGLVRDSANNLYGTTTDGGPSGEGTVYKLDPAGQKSVLYSFKRGTDGSDPQAGVIRDAAGNLYGTTLYGGTSGKGTVYAISASGQERVLHSFTGNPDGSNPQAGVIADANGTLYGTAMNGGVSGYGTVYSVEPSGQTTVLHGFSEIGGYYPLAGLAEDAAGNLYGTTQFGGLSGSGTVFKINPAGSQTVLYSFTGGTDGSIPQAGVIRDEAGNLYGTTVSGGAFGFGTVYKIDSAGHTTVLHSFTGVEGSASAGKLLRDGAGNLYGTTPYAGPVISGEVYKIDPSGQETVLHIFMDTDGSAPYDGVIRDEAGNLYGTTSTGGSFEFGTVFKIDPSGQETVLHSFTGGSDGDSPSAALIRDAAGNLYGTTSAGGQYDDGTVFKIDPSGQETVLHSFTGTDGNDPYAGVIRDSAGNLYGTTASGGSFGNGTIYKIDSSGQETVLYSFTGGADGSIPEGTLTGDSAGNLFGTAAFGGIRGEGVAFRLRLNP